MMDNEAGIPFQVIRWDAVEKVIYPGETGNAYWQTVSMPGLRLRIVEYAAGYLADHWCSKGHIVHCLSGELETEMATGEKWILSPGMTYVVSDNLSSHRSKAKEQVRLLIIDGNFLK